MVRDGVLVSARPLPAPLAAVVGRVARDFDVAEDWLNSAVGAQFDSGLPPQAERDLDWRAYGGLHVGLAGRRTLIALKLYAAADQGPKSKHVGDLVKLAPTESEWSAARAWVITQDTAPEFAAFVAEVIRHVEERRAVDR